MKVDTKLVSDGIAAAERLIEEFGAGDKDGIAASTLRLTIDCIAGAITTDHPRFNVGEFQIESMPISNERLKQAIIATMGKEGPHV